MACFVSPLKSFPIIRLFKTVGPAVTRCYPCLFTLVTCDALKSRLSTCIAIRRLIMNYASWTGSLPQVLISGQFGTSATNLHVNIPYSNLVTRIFCKKKNI